MKTEMADKITVVVPTHNRYPFLTRLLRYDQSCGAPAPLSILDSSDVKLNDPALDALIRAPHIQHVRYEAQIPPLIKISDGLQRVTTPYVVLWADDDLMVPRGLASGMRFLEEHPDFSVAHGHSGLFQTGMDDQGRTIVLSVEPYCQRSYAEPTASQRVTDCLMDYTNLFYSVHRTAELRENVQRCLSVGIGTAAYSRYDWWVELALACLSVTHGKARQVSGLYMMRDRHAGVSSWEADGAKLDLFDWIASASFSTAYRAFAGCLGDALMRQDGLSQRQAQDVIKRAFWFHLAKNLRGKWHARYDTNRGVGLRLREVARSIPGLRTAWRKARYLVPHRSGELSLPALLQASSPYHDDFVPIYQAIVALDEASPSEPCLAEALR